MVNTYRSHFDFYIFLLYFEKKDLHSIYGYAIMFKQQEMLE